MENQIRKKYYSNINCLRTLSCIAIIVMHIRANTNYKISGELYNTIIPSWTWLVYLFLIISGFSMCCGYYDKVASGTIDLEKFYLNRFKKIVPFFACLVFLGVIIDYSLESIYEGVIELTMAFGLLPNNNLSVLGVCWTLGVIFLFYMLFPYFIFLLKNRGRAWITLIITLVINQMCTLYFFTEKFIISSFTPRHSFLFCTPFFVVGGLLYLYKEDIEAFVSKYRRPMFIGCIVATISWYIVPRNIVGLDLFTIECLILFSLWTCYAIGAKSRLMSHKVMNYIGSISMEMYLAQMVIFRVIEKMKILYVLDTGWISFITVCVIEVILLVIGIEIYKIVIRNLKKVLIVHI